MIELFKTVFLFPGNVRVWWEYHFPAQGFSSVAGSGRRFRSTGVRILYSVVFWVIVAALIIAVINKKQPNGNSAPHSSAYQSGTASAPDASLPWAKDTH
jgi:hypothetical protein